MTSTDATTEGRAGSADRALTRDERRKLALLGLRRSAWRRRSRSSRPPCRLNGVAAVMSTVDGALTGFYSASRGLGVMLGPLLGGIAVSAGADAFASTEGYAAAFGVCAAACLASVPLLRAVRR